MSESPEEPAGSEDDAAAKPRVHPWKVFKGCGCASATIGLGAAVAIASGGDMAAMGAALVGVLILILVVGTSGTNGWWSND